MLQRAEYDVRATRRSGLSASSSVAPIAEMRSNHRVLNRRLEESSPRPPPTRGPRVS